MKIQISNESHQPTKTYSGVYQQQGRMITDADWNELVEIVRRRQAQALEEVVGDGSPALGGVLREVTGTEASSLWFGHVLAGGVLAAIRPREGFVDPPGSNWADQMYRGQADFEGGAALPGAVQDETAQFTLYVDVWERLVIALEDRNLRDPGLHGADTCARTEVIAQLKWCDVGRDPTDPDDNPRIGSAQFDLQLRQPEARVGPCDAPPESFELLTNNYLYRLEVHDVEVGAVDGITVQRITLKWSSENGSETHPLSHPLPAHFRAEQDDRGRAYEYYDGVSERSLGVHLNTGAPPRGRLVARLDPAVDGVGSEFIRRWDGYCTLTDESGVWAVVPDPDNPFTDVASVEGATLHLREDDWEASLSLGGARFVAGDYWLARVRQHQPADQQVQVLSASPVGVLHSYCLLGRVDRRAETDGLAIDTLWLPDTAEGHRERRRLSHPALTDLPADHVGYAPDATLPYWNNLDLGTPYEAQSAIDKLVTGLHERLCNINVRPGADIQAAIDRMPNEGGCVCLLPGIHHIDRPLRIDGRQNLQLHGDGAATKVVFSPNIETPTHRAALYIVGGSRDIQVRNLLIWADALQHIVAIDGGSREVSVAAVTLINAQADEGCSGIALGHCCHITATCCRVLAPNDILQVLPDALSELRVDLETLRNPDTSGEAPSGVPDTPEPPPVLCIKDLVVSDNTFLHGRSGVRLQDTMGGRIEGNRIRVVVPETYNGFRRVVDDDPTQFYTGLDDRLARLLRCTPMAAEAEEEIELNLAAAAAFRDPALTSRGVDACVVRDLIVDGNDILAASGVVLSYSRGCTVAGNRIVARTRGIALGYVFEADVRDNRIHLAAVEGDEKDYPQPKAPDGEAAKREDISDSMSLDDIARGLEELFGARASRLRPGNMGITSFWAFGVRVHDNDVYAPTGIGVSREALVDCAHVARASLLEVLGLTRLWDVSSALAWFSYQLCQLMASQAGRSSATSPLTRERFGERVDAWLRSLLRSPYLSPFVGKVAIDDNRLATPSCGVSQHGILTAGGIRIQGNRITCASVAGIQQHPVFSAGLPETTSAWLRCVATWLLALLVKLRDALASFLEEQGDGDSSSGGVADTIAYDLSWFMVLCSRLHSGPGDDGEGPHASVIDVKDAIDEFLDNASLCWLDDIVNQRYEIDNNVIGGSGDGIWAGLDGSQITRNRITVWPRSTVPYEAVSLGMVLLEHCNDQGGDASPLGNENTVKLATSLIELDRDWMLLSSIGAIPWITSRLDADDEESGPLRTALSDCLGRWSHRVDPASPVAEPLKAAINGLGDSDTAAAAAVAAIGDIRKALLTGLGGYGIAILGADMSCRDNEVHAKRGCSGAPFMIGSDSTSPGIALDGRQLLFDSPGIGGIWQFGNFDSLFIDAIELMCTLRRGREVAIPIGGLLSLLAWATAEERDLRVAGNQVETALVHGIRTVRPMGLQDAEIVDNAIRDAWRHGICNRSSLMLVRSDPLNIKVHRNSVHRSVEAVGFVDADYASTDLVAHYCMSGPMMSSAETADVPGEAAHTAHPDFDFANLIHIMGDLIGERADVGVALLLHNQCHGPGLIGQEQAVYVQAPTAVVIANYVVSCAERSLHVHAEQGLLTDNVVNKKLDVLGSVRVEPTNEIIGGTP